MAALVVYSLPRPLSYQEGWDLQRRLHAERSQGRRPDSLLLMEHTPVYTFGRRLVPAHLLASREDLARAGVDVVESDRGGDVTWHGPGQLVGYPILALEGADRDLHRYLRRLEDVLIATLAACGLQGTRREGLTGVWVGGRKIASLGVKVSEWVTLHGFALNRSCDLAAFARIVPCGIEGVEMTSLAAEGVETAREAIEERLLAAWQAVFGGEPELRTATELLAD